jgi:vancomycin resistance protein VanJ
MVAGPVTGAEGDEQTGNDASDLHAWPGVGIPAQRAERTSSHAKPGARAPRAAQPGIAEPEGESPQAPGSADHTSGEPEPQGPMTPPPGAATSDPAAAALAPAASAAYPGSAGPQAQAARPPSGEEDSAAPADPADAPSAVGVAAVLAAVPDVESIPRQTPPTEAGDDAAADGGGGSGEGPHGGGDGDGGGSGTPASPGTKRRRWRRRRSPMRRQTAMAITVVACLAVAFLVLHRFVPDTGGLGSLLETWLPWVGVPVAVLLIAAVVVHTRRALIATLAAALVWTALYGPQLLPRGSSAPAQLRVFSEDVNGDAHEATASGSMALAQHADVVALEDMYSSVSASSAVNGLNGAYANHVTEYEFGLWSRYPISDVQPIALGTAVPTQALSLGAADAGLAAASTGAPVIGALKATLATPHGAVVVYLVHLPQPVLGDQGFAQARDAAFTQFVALLKQDAAPRLAVIGDINVAATDRQFSQLTRNDALTSAQQAAGRGYGFTWPAEFPFVRLDDVLTRGLTPLRSVVLPSIAAGQTHLPIQVDLDY